MARPTRDLSLEEFVWLNPRDVREALQKIGVTLEILQEAVEAGYVARMSRTQNDAPNAGGLYQWNETVRTLREKLAAIGWERDDDGGLPTVINQYGTIAICVSSGDDNTGTGVTPSTKYHKGPRTVGLVESNAQIEFPFIVELQRARVKANRDANSVATWTLLFHLAPKEIRSELSLPVSIDDGGQISGWKERIILPEIPLDGGDDYRHTREPDFGPDVDIEIRRLA